MRNGLSKILTMILIIGLMYGCSDDDPVSGNDDNDNNDHIIDEEGDVDVFLTYANQLVLFERQPPVDFSEDSTGILIEVDETQKFQEMVGFGAALTGSSAYLIRQMPDEPRKELLEELFHPEEGIGISNLRITIGSSDFSIGNYSYNDIQGIENFEIPEIDERDLIPVLKEILDVYPDLYIMASPWSAPAWMKKNNSMRGGELERDHFDDFAQYLKKFVEAYEDLGIPIHAISVQNEPLHETPGYPTMYMSWQDQNEFIRDYLGPLFLSSGIDTEILIYDHNWDEYMYPINILNDSETRQYVTGSAFHGYAGDVRQMSNVHNAHPDKGLYFTEISGGQWATDFWGNIVWNMDNIFIGSVRNWSKNVLFWNLALNDDFGPRNGGCQNCRGVITISDQVTVSQNVEYYLLAHMSKFVRPGAHRVHTNDPTDDLDYIAFKNKDDSTTLIVINKSSSAREILVKTENGDFTYNIPLRTLATFRW